MLYVAVVFRKTPWMTPLLAPVLLGPICGTLCVVLVVKLKWQLAAFVVFRHKRTWFYSERINVLQFRDPQICLSILTRMGTSLLLFKKWKELVGYFMAVLFIAISVSSYVLSLWMKPFHAVIQMKVLLNSTVMWYRLLCRARWFSLSFTEVCE